MTGKVGLLGLAFLTIFIFGNFYLQFTGAPPRTQTARLEPFGEINVHLQTQPDPPKTGGIPLIVHITDQGGKGIAVDQVQYEYQSEKIAAQTLNGESTAVGEFKAIAALTDVGVWTVRVTVFKGGQQTKVSFTLRVMPNI